MPLKDLTGIKSVDIKYVIDEYIHSERDRAVILDKFINDPSFEKLGERH